MVQKALSVQTKVDSIIKLNRQARGLYALNRTRISVPQSIVSPGGATPSSAGSSGGVGNFLETQGDTMIGPIAFFPVLVNIATNGRIDIGEATTTGTTASDYSTYVLVTGVGTPDDLNFIEGANYQGQYLILQGTANQIINIIHAHLPGISNISGTGTVTVVTSVPHLLLTGHRVNILGTTNFDASDEVITVTGASTFTYVDAGDVTPETSGLVQDGNIVTPSGKDIALDGTISPNGIPIVTFVFDAIVSGFGAWRVVSDPSGQFTQVPDGTADFQHLEWDNTGTQWTAEDAITLQNDTGLIKWKNAANTEEATLNVTTLDNFLWTDFTTGAPHTMTFSGLKLQGVGDIRSDNIPTPSTGFIQLGNTDSIDWRNFANDNDASLEFNAADNFEFTILSAGGIVATIGASLVDFSLAGGRDISAGGTQKGMRNIGELQFIDNTATPSFDVGFYSNGTDMFARTGGISINLTDNLDGKFTDVQFDVHDETNTGAIFKINLDGATDPSTSTLDFNSSVSRTYTFPNASGNVFITTAVEDLNMGTFDIFNTDIYQFALSATLLLDTDVGMTSTTTGDMQFNILSAQSFTFTEENAVFMSINPSSRIVRIQGSTSAALFLLRQDAPSATGTLSKFSGNTTLEDPDEVNISIVGTGNISSFTSSGITMGANMFINNVDQIGFRISGNIIQDDTGGMVFATPPTDSFTFEDGTDIFATLDKDLFAIQFASMQIPKIAQPPDPGATDDAKLFWNTANNRMSFLRRNDADTAFEVINLEAGSTSFIGFTADADLVMAGFDITFTVGGDIVMDFGFNDSKIFFDGVSGVGGDTYITGSGTSGRMNFVTDGNLSMHIQDNELRLIGDAVLTINERSNTNQPTAVSNTAILYAKEDGVGGVAKLGIIESDGTDIYPLGAGGGGSSFADDVFDVHDNVTPAKIFKFALDGMASGTTLFDINNTVARVITFPDTSGTVAFTNVGQTWSSTQIFTGFTDLQGNIDLGDTTADTITFQGRFDSNIIPTVGSVFDVGDPTRKLLQVVAVILNFGVSNGSAVEIRGNTGGIEYKMDVGDTHEWFQGSTSLMFLNSTKLDMQNLNIEDVKDIKVDSGRVRAFSGTEIGFYVTNSTAAVGSLGTIQIPSTTETALSNADRDTRFGTAVGSIGVMAIGASSPIFLIKKTSGWAGVSLGTL